ncbi:hypothetical protein KJ365_03640 [Glaciecola sp. XM2]|uniref:hypothetical protein n=1 Tax=Glaciecola sp. XM2 TaxID=1914931 RepID=UPI001BDE1917|nr:hypothetical protein [Glaciecola sp. XM2]MBT1449962.1 hypothetical protein [Glaciecola sp. XM2]
MNESKQDLQSKIDALARGKAPQRDLWRGIEQAIVNEQDNAVRETSKGAWRRSSLAIAASFLAIALLAYGSFYTGQQTQSMLLVEQLSEQHSIQKQGLLVSFKDMPSSTNNWQQQLEDLAQAEAAIKKALEDAPNNPALIGMLKHVYQQELAIIERVHAPAWQSI